MNPSLFGAPLTECKLQTTNVVITCVTFCIFISLTLFALQVISLSYHALSGNIIVGLYGDHVEMWLFDPLGHVPAHECVRERLTAAHAQVKEIQTSIEKTDNGLRQRMSREQELKRSIADLEVKCAYTYELLQYSTNMS